MNPTQSSLNYPPVDTKTAAIGFSAFCDDRVDVSASQFNLQWARMVPSVSLQLKWSLTRPAPLALQGRDGIDQSECLGDVVDVGCGQSGRKRYPLSVGYNMVLATRLGPVRGIGTRLLPPKTARTDALSTTARLQSIRSVACKRSRQTLWIRSHTPAFCQSRSLRQQVIPLPQSISWGRSSQPIPVLRTNRMPVRAALSGTRGLPPFGFGDSGGRSGSISSHSLSDTSGFAIRTTSH